MCKTKEELKKEKPLLVYDLLTKLAVGFTTNPHFKEEQLLKYNGKFNFGDFVLCLKETFSLPVKKTLFFLAVN